MEDLEFDWYIFSIYIGIYGKEKLKVTAFILDNE